jgi:hypothetical protein
MAAGFRCLYISGYNIEDYGIYLMSTPRPYEKNNHPWRYGSWDPKPALTPREKAEKRAVNKEINEALTVSNTSDIQSRKMENLDDY